MNFREIERRLDLLTRNAQAKGFSVGDCWYAQRWLGECCTVRITLHFEGEQVESAFHNGEDPDEAFTKARRWLNSVTDPRKAQADRWRAELGRLIDKGREIGIETDFLNPLAETMKRLSENALTHEPTE